MRYQRTGDAGAWRARLARLAAATAVVVALGLVSVHAHAVDPNAQEEQSAASVSKQANKETKAWFVDGLFETHWAVVQDQDNSNDVYHWVYLRGNYDFGKIGRVSLRLDATQRYVHDPGESSFEFGDIRLYYSRGFKFSLFSQDFDGRGYFYWTFPTALASRRQGNIARPTLQVALHKALPYGFDVYVRPFARINWARYTTTTHGAPNAKWMLGYDFLANYTLPFHKALSFGGSVGQYWFDRYQVRDGVGQPWNMYFWWEAYAGYSILKKPLALDAYLAMTSGDFSVDNGVAGLFEWFDRDKTEMYLSIRAMY